MADRDPEAAAAQASANIEELRNRPDAFREAQLYAVIAQARYYQSRIADTNAAAARAESLLDTLPASSDVDRIRLRVRTTVADTSESVAMFESAVKSMNGLVASTQTQSAEHSCALSIRGQAQSELGSLALAAADAFEAYRIAQAGHWQEAEVTAAYVMATIYRRSGLLSDAERLINEVVVFATADERTPLLSNASYVRGQILIDMGRFKEARASLELSQRSATLIGDSFGSAVANVALCLALIGENELAAAERACASGEAEFEAAGTPDFVALLTTYRARLDLAHHQPMAALAKLNVVLRAQQNGGLMRLQVQTLRDRSRVYESLGRHREAYKDLRDSLDLESKVDVDRQSLTVAVLSATASSEKLLASNHDLEERMQHQQQELAQRMATQEHWFVLAIAALVLSIVFGWLFAVARRLERRAARREIIMRTMAIHAPDSLMLLNVDRTVRSSNRSLLGTGPRVAPGTALVDAIPADARAAVDAAVGEMEMNRQPISFPVAVRDDAGQVRHFELRGVPIVEKSRLIGITLRATDVTEFHRLEREVIEVASRERQRLSSDLHEGLGQELTGISLLLASLSTSVERGRRDVGDLILEVRDHIDRCIDMTRELARGLSPVQIERGSLGTALDRLAADASRRLRLQITSHSDIGDLPVSDVASDHLYRIAYEALTNAARHSGCTRVMVDLRTVDNMLQLSISDDGRGITSPGAPSSGLGVKMMRYRMRLLGGRLHVGAGPNGGTQLVVSVPVASIAPAEGDDLGRSGLASTGQQNDDADENHPG